MSQKFPAKVRIPTIATSTAIYYESGRTIISAKLIATYTGNIIFFLSADDGSNWESVTNNVTHNFTNTGEKLRWRAIGTSSAELTLLKVKYT